MVNVGIEIAKAVAKTESLQLQTGIPDRPHHPRLKPGTDDHEPVATFTIGSKANFVHRGYLNESSQRGGLALSEIFIHHAEHAGVLGQTPRDAPFAVTVNDGFGGEAKGNRERFVWFALQE